MKSRIENDHNVYIFGAGFSVPAGLPTIPNFLRRMRDALPWLAERQRQEEVRAIEAVFTFRHDASSASFLAKIDVENVEQLFSLASATPGTERLQSDFSLAIAATLSFCEETAKKSAVWLSTHASPEVQPYWRVLQGADGISDGYLLSLHDHIAQVLFSKFAGDRPSLNSVVTFNYDHLLEDSLHRLGVPFTYGFRSGAAVQHTSAVSCASGVPVFKLHGSLNWAREKGRRKAVTVVDSYATARGFGLRPVIVPPTWRKTFSNELGPIWDGAVSAIERATRLVICGLSMAAADGHFGYLLAAGLRRNISLRQVVVIDPNAEIIVEKLGDLLHRIDSIPWCPVAMGCAEAIVEPKVLRVLGRALPNHWARASILQRETLDHAKIGLL